jgi:serine/threonine-protein kinase
MLREDERGESLLDDGLAETARGVFEADADAEAPRRVGRYRILRRLGEGGMGVVYLAEREDLGGLVAVKLLRDSWVSAERRERFAKEQRFLASLEHPSIARLYDADTLPDGTPYFVLEFVEGVPLIEYCESRRASLAERLALFRAVCEAVQYAHGHALVHRDLKSSNVLVKADGSVRLLDFGIAKQLSPEDGGQSPEATQGLSFMTPAYAAPEQLAQGLVGLYTDVYALGVILYRLLTGSLPFELAGHTRPEVLRIVLEQLPVRPSLKQREQGGQEWPGAPNRADWADLDVLVLKALHKEPARRYRTVDALIRDLDHFSKHEPLDARPDSLGYRAQKFVRRKRVPLAVAGAVLVTVVGLVTFFTLRLTHARNQALAEVARTHRIERFMERLFAGGDDLTVPSEELRVVTLVDRGVREARALERDPAVQGDLFHTLGTIYGDLGRFEQGRDILRAALERRRSAFGAHSAEVGETEVALALLHNDAAEFDEAERLARDATGIAEKLPADHPLRASADGTLGRVFLGRGDYARALPLFERATHLLERRGDDPFNLSLILGDWANTEYYLGHYAVAKSLNLRGLELDTRTFGDKHVNVASDLINLGCIAQEFGQYAEAERLHRQALAISEAWYGPKHLMTASNLGLLGRALTQQGRASEAKPLLERALAIDEAVFSGDHPKVSILLHDLGVANRELGELDAAEARFTRMLAMEQALHPDGHERIGLAHVDLASVASERHDYPKAESELREALAVYAKRLAPDHVRAGEAHVALGHLLLAAHRYPEAEAESRAGFGILSGHTGNETTAARTAERDLAQLATLLHPPSGSGDRK